MNAESWIMENSTALAVYDPSEDYTVLNFYDMSFMHDLKNSPKKAEQARYKKAVA